MYKASYENRQKSELCRVLDHLNVDVDELTKRILTDGRPAGCGIRECLLKPTVNSLFGVEREVKATIKDFSNVDESYTE